MRVIPPIELQWSDWHEWADLATDARVNRDAPRVPNQSGVYEVRAGQGGVTLTIGKAANLRTRVKQALVRGKSPHSSGTRIRDQEDVALLVVRWALTDRPAAVEEELHLRHVAQHGCLPRHTRRT